MIDDLTTIRERWAGVDAGFAELRDFPFRLTNYSGQLVVTGIDPSGRDSIILCEIGCPNCSEWPSKHGETADAIGEALAHAPADIRALLDALAACDAALQARSLTVAELLGELERARLVTNQAGCERLGGELSG